MPTDELITPGAEIVASSMYNSKCRTCKDELVIACLRGLGRNYRAFDRQPIERNGLRFYRRHRCDPRKILHTTQT